MWSWCNEGIAAVSAGSLVEGDHSIAVAVVAANSLPVECAPYIDPASLLSKVDRSRT